MPVLSLLIAKPLSTSPTAELFHHLGRALGRLERWEEAKVAYEESLALKPFVAVTRNNLGLALKEMGQLFDAEKVLRLYSLTILGISMWQPTWLAFYWNKVDPIWHSSFSAQSFVVQVTTLWAGTHLVPVSWTMATWMSHSLALHEPMNKHR